MNITLLTVGKLKERYWRDAVCEYAKRLGKYCRLQITEVRESPIKTNASPADEDITKASEGKEILSKIKPSDYVITLEIKGKPFSSDELAEHIGSLALSGKSSVVFIIGGSLGLSPEVSRRADLKLSFSAMTFPHQMMRVILLEQIYRSFKILKHETYHK